jgi:hypothetical protein
VTTPGRKISPSASTPGAVKPTFLTTVPSTPTDPFASVFQAFTQTFGSSSTKTSATAATTTQTGTTAPTSTTATASTAATTATASTGAADTTAQQPGIEALVNSIVNGTFQATYVTDPTRLEETSPLGTETMPSFYYASDQTANQMAQLLGGTVVQVQPFGQDKGFTEPYANYIQLPNGQTFNAADVAYFARNARSGSAQLTSDITATINIGSAWTNWYKNGGAFPVFPGGYVGPPISGMTYPDGSIGADGNVINPSAQSAVTNT